MSPRYTPVVSALPSTVPFVGPETQERARGRVFKARLGANESGFGPSPRVIEALRAAAPDAWMYGDPEGHDLRHSIAALHGVGSGNVVLGEGIDGLLGTLVRLLVSPGEPVVSSLGAYPTFAFHVRGQGGSLTEVPYAGDFEDLSGLANAARQVNAKLVYLANPDNPMGTWHDAPGILEMYHSLPEDCVLVLDEAYADLAPASALPELDMGLPNFIRMRTFSKAHGLAGMRIGYALADTDLISAFDKIRNHFGVGRLSQTAALASLADKDWLPEVFDRVTRARQKIREIAGTNDLVALPSATNFVTIDCGQDGKFAGNVLAELANRGVFIRKPFVAPQDRCIRVSVGPDAELDVFAAALPQALAAARDAIKG